MPIKAEILAQIHRIVEEMKKDLPPLVEDLVLVDSGLDSLGIAILISRLDQARG